ncbi:hypothetical protein [Flexithrix dorotheae]|uniref:hypothetical protein n=1 Tax=Flexithrix dorotheae TaxID=70993 RepID=UPI00036C2454|nr:hypothetical protein [Flexithrix dorotheae]
MEIKYTKNFLAKLEDLFSETTYILRYEKGNFKSGYCLLKDNKVAIINKYFPLEGRINSLVDIIKEIEINPQDLSEKNKKLFIEIRSAKQEEGKTLFN